MPSLHSLCKPLATGKNASILCSPKGRQVLNIVKGLFLAARSRQQALTQPEGISKCDNAKTSAVTRLSTMHADDFKHFIAVCYLTDKNLEEPFVLWKSTCPCQNAFKWTEPKRSRANLKKVKGGGQACLSKSRFCHQSEHHKVRNVLPKFIKCLM